MQINNLRYDGRKSAFEASVEITRQGRTYRYPCKVFGPANIDPAILSANLRDRALRMSDTARR